MIGLAFRDLARGATRQAIRYRSTRWHHHANPDMADFVLLHGTTQSPAGWAPLIDRLEARGHQAFAPKFPPAPHLSGEVIATETVRQLPDSLASPVVVGHSGGALILPALARLVGAKHQVSIASPLPDGQRSLFDEIEKSPEMINGEWTSVGGKMDDAIATYFLFHDCNFSTLRWAISTLRSWVPIAVYQEVIQPLNRIESTYISCKWDRTVDPTWCCNRARAVGIDNVIELETGHCPHASNPEMLTRILELAAAR